MKYKQWATDETWLPEGPGKKILTEVPKDAPSIVQPDTSKMMEVNALAHHVKNVRIYKQSKENGGLNLFIMGRDAEKNGVTWLKSI